MIYVHRNNVRNKKLFVGNEIVEYNLSQGEKGLTQAIDLWGKDGCEVKGTIQESKECEIDTNKTCDKCGFEGHTTNDCYPTSSTSGRSGSASGSSGAPSGFRGSTWPVAGGVRWASASGSSRCIRVVNSVFMLIVNSL